MLSLHQSRIIKVVPVENFEISTYRLSSNYSAFELHRELKSGDAYGGRSRSFLSESRVCYQLH